MRRRCAARRCPACATSSATARICRRGVIAWEDFLAGGEPRSTPWSVASLDSRRRRPTTPPSSSPRAAPPRRRASCTRTPAMLAGADNVARPARARRRRRAPTAICRSSSTAAWSASPSPPCRAAARCCCRRCSTRTRRLRLLERHRCTTLFAWPHQAEALIRHPRFDRERLRIRKGPGANTKWAAALLPPDHQAVGTWGMSETGPMASSQPLGRSAGRPRRRARPADAGPRDAHRRSRHQCAAAGGSARARSSCAAASLMRTYYKRDAARVLRRARGSSTPATAAASMRRGRLHFIGRIKDVIKTAGVNVAAAEVEAVLLAASRRQGRARRAGAASDAAARTSPRSSCRSDRRPAAPPTLQAHCREALASYKVPRHVFFVAEEELPTLGSGKVDRQAAARRRRRELAASGERARVRRVDAKAQRNRPRPLQLAAQGDRERATSTWRESRPRSSVPAAVRAQPVPARSAVGDRSALRTRQRALVVRIERRRACPTRPDRRSAPLAVARRRTPSPS